MSDVFISYARSTERRATQIAEALKSLGYTVWRDDELPAHRDYSEVIEERLKAAKAVVVVWSAEAVKSQWVRAEADVAREAGTMVQLSLDGAPLPMPFNRIQCADMAGWNGDLGHAGWRKVLGSVADLAGATASAASGPAAETRHRALPDKPSIAVLPFADLSAARDQDYFCDGMVEEIVTALSRFSNLFVIAAASSLSFRETNRDIGMIARRLGVRYVLEGSVRRAGGSVRIAVSLTDALDNIPVWSNRFDGDLSDIFELQDAVAHAAASQIAPTLTQAEIERANTRPPANLGAYELYLRARARHVDDERQGYEAAIGFLDQAIDAEPNYASALASAAFVRCLLVLEGWATKESETGRVSVELARKALRFGGENAEILATVGLILNHLEGDATTADALVARAVQLNPGSANVWHQAGFVAIHNGRLKAGLEGLETAARLNPRSPFRHILLAGQGLALTLMRRFDDALPLLREALQRRPGLVWPRAVLGAALALSGREEDAIATLASMPTGWSASAFLASFRVDADAELLRHGLRLAGVDV